MKTITSVVTSYQADDGTQFRTKDMCIAHDQLMQLIAVINADWPVHLSRDADTIALMMVATWDRLDNAMEVQNEELISNSRVELETQSAEPTSEEVDDIDPSQYALAYLYAEKWATEYTMSGVGHRTYNANLKEAFNRKMSEFKKQAAPKRSNPATVFNWYTEYPELSAGVVQGAMAAAALQAAIEHTVDSEDYCTMYTIEIARILDTAAATATANAAQEKAAGIDYYTQCSWPTY